MTYTIEEITQSHWRDTLVLQGETPEAYAIRNEEVRLRRVRLDAHLRLQMYGRNAWLGRCV